MSFMNMDQAYVANTYKRFPVEIVSGKGSRVTDVNGKEYVDMGSGIGVTAFGIADDAWVAATTAQLMKLQHVSNLYYTEPCALLAKALWHLVDYGLNAKTAAQINERIRKNRLEKRT